MSHPPCFRANAYLQSHHLFEYTDYIPRREVIYLSKKKKKKEKEKSDLVMTINYIC